MREKIMMTTTLWLGSHGDISTIQRDRLTPFTMKQVLSGASIKAKDESYHCRLWQSSMNDNVEMLLMFNGNYNLSSLPLTEWLSQNGLELKGVPDEPCEPDYTEYVLTEAPLEHAPTKGVPVTVYDDTPLYLTPMGTISLSDARDHEGKTSSPFTIDELKAGLAVSASNGSMSCTLQPTNGLVHYSAETFEPTKSKDGSYMTFSWLLVQNGLWLSEHESNGC